MFVLNIALYNFNPYIGYTVAYLRNIYIVYPSNIHVIYDCIINTCKVLYFNRQSY